MTLNFHLGEIFDFDSEGLITFQFWKPIVIHLSKKPFNHFLLRFYFEDFHKFTEQSCGAFGATKSWRITIFSPKTWSFFKIFNFAHHLSGDTPLIDPCHRLVLWTSYNILQIIFFIVAPIMLHFLFFNSFSIRPIFYDPTITLHLPV